MSLFKSKSGSADLPVTQVKALSDRGYSDNDIKDILRKKGYSENEINITLQKALVTKVNGQGKGILPLDHNQTQQNQGNQDNSHSDLEHHKEDPHESDLLPHSKKVDDIKKEFGHSSNTSSSSDLFSSIGAKQHDLSFDEDNELPEPPSTPHDDSSHQEGYEIDLEPIVEAIVEEKWNDISYPFEDIQERLDKLESIVSGGIKSDDVAQVEYLAKQVQERVDRLEQSLDDVSIKVNSIEKAFKQFIPSLTGNIKALSNAVRQIKVKEPGQVEEQ